MKLYVAGSSREASEIASYMQALRIAGHEITFDWTAPVLAAITPDRDLSEEERSHHAMTDILGVLEADLVWLLIPSTGSIGAWIEMGIALGTGKRLIVSGDWRKTIFTSHARRYDMHAEAYHYISGAT